MEKLSVTIALCLVWSCSAAEAATQCGMQRLAALKGHDIRITGINNDGVIVGTVNATGSRGDEKGFRLDDGMVKILPGVNGDEAAPFSINNKGLIGGESGEHAALWSPKGKLTDLTPFGGHGEVIVLGLNDAGVGVGIDDDLAVMFRDGQYVALHPYFFPGSEEHSAIAINNVDQIVGTARDANTDENQAFLLDHGIVSYLGDLGGVELFGGTSAADVNDAGQVVGMTRFQSSPTSVVQQLAYLWESGVMKSLGTLGGASSWANAINERGEVTGGSSTRSGEIHAFLWRKGKMIDLGTLGGTYSEGMAINDAGTIVGDSVPRGSDTTQTRGFKWKKSC